jgi:hypothetical protein
VGIERLEKSRDSIDAIDPRELRAHAGGSIVIILAMAGSQNELEMRVDHADERLELANIDGNSRLKLLP